MNRIKISLSLLLLLLVLQPAQAQKGRQRSRNLGILTLASNPAVFRDLKLNDEQKTTLKKATTTARAENKSTQGLEEEARSQKRRQITKKLRGVISRTCDDTQQKRLFQIEIQWTSGSWMLLRPELSSVLKLTKEQRRQIREMSKASQLKARKIRATGDDSNRREVQRKVDELLAQVRQDAIKLLTAEQQKSWKTAHGKAFEFPQRKKAKKKSQT